MLQKFLNETEIFFDECKKLSYPDLSSYEKSKIINKLKKRYIKLIQYKSSVEEEKILIAQKMYAMGKIIENEIPKRKNQIEYKLQQLKLKAKGRAERNRRTYQLIFIGSIWEQFLFDNNLSNFCDVKKFENALHKISNVNIAEENIIIGHDDFDLPVSPYTGHDKKIIHYYCQIGGMWESFWRGICKNDLKDKKIFTILKTDKIDLEKIKDNNFSDFKFFCDEKHCQKIGSYKNFFKSRCLKLDHKFFYLFLKLHKKEIIDVLVQA